MHGATPSVFLENAIPILRVDNLKASMAYYTSVLGFHQDWLMDGVMGSVSRDRASLMLCQGGQGHPGTWVWIGVSDATALHADFDAKGATILVAPRNYPWALEFHVEDPDGHVLRFGSESLANRPHDAWLELSTR